MTLHQGDCLKIMPTLPDKSVDLVLCDLPYGTTENAWDAVIPFEPLWAEYKRLCKGAIVLTATQPFAAALVMSNPSAFKYEWVWDKVSPTGWLNAKKQPMRRTESVLVFCYGKVPYNPQGLVYKPRLKSRVSDSMGSSSYRSGIGETNIAEYQGYPTNVLRFMRESGLHPTQKSLGLMEYLVKTYTKPGDVVLDNTMGSGTTGVACVNTGRSFIGIEMAPEYFAIAKARIEPLQAPVEMAA